MEEIIAALPSGAWVLDLGSAGGSLSGRGQQGVSVVGLDLDDHASPGRIFVRADAARLPFRDASFDAVVANHSFEHFADFERAVDEVARVLRSCGFVYVSVPDASTLCDRVYRWLARGGGHVNAFTNSGQFVRIFVDHTGLRHAGTRLLYSGFSFLNRRNAPGGRLPRRGILVGGGYEPVLRIGVRLLHSADRLFGTRLAVYGWAFYFGDLGRVDETPRPNVCVGCGAGHPVESLAPVRRVLGWSWYRCPSCGARNYLVRG
jgi:SAM-dependent methyltransferase